MDSSVYKRIALFDLNYTLTCILVLERRVNVPDRIHKKRKIRRLDKHLNCEEVQLCLNGLLILRGCKK